MAVKTYDWQEQLARGQEWEKKLDTYFSKWYDIREARMDEQWKGVDREFTRGGKTYLVEYKADDLTRKTGNVFVETYSRVPVGDMDLGRYGWAWTSKANILVYLAIPKTIYVVKPEAIRWNLDFFKRKYGERDVTNKGYKSRGIPVPKDVFAGVCDKVITVKSWE